MKRTVIATVAGAALAGAVGIGVAGAATGTGPGGRVAEVLSGLVSDGTITQDQADAVAQALEDARAEAQAQRDEDRAARQEKVDALLQDTLGMTRDEVLAALQEGKTLKEIAGGRADELAAGAVALVEEQAKQAVSDGRLTQAQADEVVARAKERADAWLAGEDTGMGRGFGLGLLLGRGLGMEPGMGLGMGPGMGHHGGGPRGGRMGPHGDADDSDSATAPPSAGAAAWRT